MVERLALYRRVVGQVVEALGEEFGARRLDAALWRATKVEYAVLIAGHIELELAETFYNSVTRKLFATVGVDREREFVATDGAAPPAATAAPVRTYPGLHATPTVVRELLDDHAFGIPWADAAGDARAIAATIDRATTAAWGAPTFDFLETLDPVFYRNKGAYLVGRVVRGDAALPMVIAFLNPGSRVRADAVLLSEAEVSIVFSFTRSYFHVDVESPSGTIRYLRQLLPRKPVAELYNSLGFDKQGKTELYRDLVRHVEGTSERFAAAPGERGLVMIVFTLPGFDVVFKVIRDRFGPGKTVTREEVRQKYRLVAEHDRAGRLVDVQEFEHLVFPRDRFEPELLAELLGEAAQEVRLQGEQVVVGRLFTERRVTPLNLYLRDAEPGAAEAAVLDYGAALRDLAVTNIFPGDLLIKNFGVTRHGRVVFYDYDELSTVTECAFRSLPDDDDAWGGGEASVYAGPRDIFPEELLRFLGLPRPLAARVAQAHAELLDPAFWNRVKRRLAAGEILDLFPYPAESRLPSG